MRTGTGFAARAGSGKNYRARLTVALAAHLLFSATMAVAGTEKKTNGTQGIRFSGYDWDVRQAGLGGPGPNQWEPGNAWVDAKGQLHLKITHGKDGGWRCAEVATRRKFGLGRYQFQITGPLGQLDPNVVLGLFDYPTPDIGPDGTHEIDIEFSRWGHPASPEGNFTVYPALPGLANATHGFAVPPGTLNTTQRFVRERGKTSFQSLRGFPNGNAAEFARWVFPPADPEKRISQAAMPILLNLWLFQGKPPQDGRDVEIIVRQFSFQPERHP